MTFIFPGGIDRTILHRHLVVGRTPLKPAGPPVSCDYTPKGSISKIGDVDTYFVGQCFLLLTLERLLVV